MRYFIVLTVFACACSDAQREMSPAFGVDGDVPVVANTDVGSWPSTPWVVEEDLRIGGGSGASTHRFGQVFGIAVGPNGHIYVLDRLPGQIRVFDSQGRRVKDFAHQGGGPGELGRGAGPILLASGDTLVVPDRTNLRVNLYSLDGESLGSYRRVDLGAEGAAVRWATNEGIIVNQVRPLGLPPSMMSDEHEQAVGLDVIASRRLDGSVIDTLLTCPSGRTVSLAGGVAQYNLFVPEPSWAVIGDRIVYGVNDEYRLRVLRRGELERIISKPSVQRPVSPVDRRLAIDGLTRYLRNSGVSPMALANIWRSVTVAEFFPQYMRIEAGPAGSIWVRHYTVPSELSADMQDSYNPLRSESSEWDVFDGEGRFLGVVRMPDRFNPWLFSDDTIFGVQKDEMDVESVVRLRIIRPAK